LAYAGPAQAEPRRPEPEVRVVEAEAVTANPEPVPEEAALDTETAAKASEDATRWELPDPDRAKRSPAERVWRLTPASRERQDGRRAKQWRPADAPRPVSVFDPATEQDFMARRQALMQLLAPPVANAQRLQEALRTFLASPVLEQVERYNDAERWIAGLIAGEAPRSDALIDVAIEHFRWDEGRVGPRSLVGARVLARRDDLRFLNASNGIGSPHPGAWPALSRPPSRWRVVVNRLTPDLGRRVGAFLAVVRSQRPGLAGSLNKDAVAWWDAYLSKPRLGPIAVWALLVTALIPLLSLAGQGGRAAIDPRPVWAIFAVAVSIVLVRLFAIAWPRRLWRRRWAQTAPAWVRVGWAPAALVPLALAALIPASDRAAGVLAVLALAVMFWATTVAEPDTRQIGQPIPPFRWRGPIISFPFAIVIYYVVWLLLRPGVRFAWPIRSLFAFTYLAIFWLIAGEALPGRAADQMSVPLIAAAVAFVAGAGTLDAGWRRLRRRTQRAALAGLAVLLGSAVATLWFARSQPTLGPIAATLICAAVLLHKTPASELYGVGATVRDAAMRFGGLALVWQLGSASTLVDAVSELILVLVLCGLGVVIAFIRRFRQRTAKPGGFGEIAAAVVRYGWIVAVPFAAVAGGSGGGGLLLVGGIWILTGVGVTLAVLAPLPWEPKTAG
jgi:hypothetical protein